MFERLANQVWMTEYERWKKLPMTQDVLAIVAELLALRTPIDKEFTAPGLLTEAMALCAARQAGREEALMKLANLEYTVAGKSLAMWEDEVTGKQQPERNPEDAR
jgi:hypothetical protein